MGRKLCGRFKLLINNISHEKIWTRLRTKYLKREKESLRLAAEKQRHKNQPYQSENR